MCSVTLEFNRRTHVLWLFSSGKCISAYYPVTGVKRVRYSRNYDVFLQGIPVGMILDVQEVKERW